MMSIVVTSSESLNFDSHLRRQASWFVTNVRLVKFAVCIAFQQAQLQFADATKSLSFDDLGELLFGWTLVWLLCENRQRR